MNANEEKAEMPNSDQPFAHEGYELMGAAFEVHNVQGGGLLEEIYQQSLEVEENSNNSHIESRRD